MSSPTFAPTINPHPSKNGLSSGGVAGIVMAIAVVVFLIFMSIYYWCSMGGTSSAHCEVDLSNLADTHHNEEHAKKRPSTTSNNTNGTTTDNKKKDDSRDVEILL